MNVAWDEQFLAPLWLIPRIPGMNSKSQEKRVFYNTKLTLVTQEFTKIRLSPMPAPRWWPKGPRWSREVRKRSPKVAEGRPKEPREPVELTGGARGQP